MTTALALILGMMCPVLLGMPLVGAVAQRVVFKRPAAPTPEGRIQAAVVRTFSPLDLGPDLVKWPSEVPKTFTPFPEPPWPSEGWNDPHFGRKRTPASAMVQPVAEPVRGKPPVAAVAEAALSGQGRVTEKPRTGFGGLTDAQIRALVETEGLVKAVEILVEQAGVDPGTVARELRRIPH